MKKTFLVATAAAALVAAGGGVALAQPSGSQFFAAPNGISFNSSGVILASTSHNGHYTEWTTNSFGQLQQSGTGNCLTADDAGNEWKAEACSLQLAAQQISYPNEGSGFDEIKDAADGKCADANVSNADLRLYACNGSNNEVFIWGSN